MTGVGVWQLLPLGLETKRWYENVIRLNIDLTSSFLLFFLCVCVCLLICVWSPSVSPRPPPILTPRCNPHQIIVIHSTSLFSLPTLYQNCICFLSFFPLSPYVCLLSHIFSFHFLLLAMLAGPNLPADISIPWHRANWQHRRREREKRGREWKKISE